MKSGLSLKERGYQPLALWQIIVAAGVFIALMVVTAIGDNDLAINRFLANDNSAYGWFFAKFGEAATYITIPLGATFIFLGISKDKKWRILRIVALIVVIVGNFVFVNWLYKRAFYIRLYDSVAANIDMASLPYIMQKTVQLYDLLRYPVLILMTCGFTVLDLLCFKWMDEETRRKMFIFGVFALITVAIAIGIVSLLKLLWARERFRVMAEMDNFEGFRRWWQPAAFINTDYRTEEYMAARNAVDEGLGFDGDAFKSFPSGHSVAASMIFTVILLPDIFEKLKKYRAWFYIVPAVVTAAVAISRVVNRAHYLSDVTVGAFTGFTTACLVRRLAWKLYDFNSHQFLLLKPINTVLIGQAAEVDAASETVVDAQETENAAAAE